MHVNIVEVILMKEYVKRVIDLELDELLPCLPAIAFEGPKGVGKTATAKRRAKTVFRLDMPSERAIAEASPEQVLKGEFPVLLDEWQHVPTLWDAVRRSVDENSIPGSFLLTGSAGPLLPPTHSGAGRIVKLRMRPMTLSERGLDTPTVSLKELLQGNKVDIYGKTNITLSDYVHEIVSSGFPGIRHLSGRSLRLQLDGYLRCIVDKDFVEQGYKVRKPKILERWLRAYAAATATTSSYETIRDATTGGEGHKPSKTVIHLYREILERLWILDPVPAWITSRNYLNKLSHPPKHHLTDPALAVQLLGLSKDALLSGQETGLPIPKDGNLLGHLFESLVTLDVRVYAQAAEAEVSHLRQYSARHEVDLIVERPDKRILAIEVKLGNSVDNVDVKHLLWLREQLGDDLLDAIVIYTGPQAYRRKDGIAVIPASLFGA